MIRRAFVASMLGVTAALLVGLASVSIADAIGGGQGAAIERMGISTGGVVGVLATLATLLFVGGHRRVGTALFAVLVVIGVGFLAWAGGRVPPRPTLVLSASDRVGLRELHDAGFEGSEHPTLGFRLPRAPDHTLAASDEIEREMRAASAPGWSDAHQIWAFETPDRAVSVVVDLSRVETADRDSLARFDRAVTGPLEAAGHRTTRRDPEGHDGCWRERFAGELTSGGHVEGALFAFDDRDRALRLVVTAVSGDASAWSRWVDGVSLACER